MLLPKTVVMGLAPTNQIDWTVLQKDLLTGSRYNPRHLAVSDTALNLRNTPIVPTKNAFDYKFLLERSYYLNVNLIYRISEYIFEKSVKDCDDTTCR
jgi:hypothetical protein